MKRKSFMPYVDRRVKKQKPVTGLDNKSYGHMGRKCDKPICGGSLVELEIKLKALEV